MKISVNYEWLASSIAMVPTQFFQNKYLGCFKTFASLFSDFFQT